MSGNVDNLNFKVILDDQDFNDKVQKDIQAAKDLNVQLSALLRAKADLSRGSTQGIDSAKLAEAEEKVRTQVARTTTEREKAKKVSTETILAQQRIKTETQRTAAATGQAAANSQRYLTEVQRTKKAMNQAALSAQKLARETGKATTATANAAAATAKAELAQRRLADYSARATKQMRTQSRLMSDLGSLAMRYVSIYGAGRLISSLVRVTGEFELQKTTLAAMLGDLNEAENIITRIQGLAVESPFQFKELTTYAKQLSAFSVPAEELFETTKMLADVSAGLGVDMNRIVLAYGQVRSAAFLRGQEVRQFTEAGIPILDELAKQFEELEGQAVSTGEVFDRISARLVPFEMVAKVFKDMTSEGGKFYQMQEIQAETLRGKLSNLKDAYEIMLNEIGEGQSENLKKAADWLRRLVQNYEDTGRVILELIAAYGIYRATLLLTMNLQSSLARNLVVLRQQFRKLTAALSSNPYAAFAAAAVAVVGVVYKIGKEMKKQSVIAESMSKSQRKYNDELNKNLVSLDALKAKLELAEKGSKEYNSAISAIQRNYAPYIKQLEQEGAQIDTLAGLYDNLKRKIEESAHARFIAFARQDLDTTFAQKISDIINGTGAQGIYNLQRAVDSIGLNDAEAIILRMFISGSTTWEEITEKYADLAEKVEKAYVSLGSGSSGPMKAKNYLDILKGSVTNLTNEYAQATATIDEFATAVTSSANTSAPLSLFAQKVQDTLAEFGATKENKGKLASLWADNTTEYYEYLENIRQQYGDIQQKIKDVGTTQAENLPDLEKQKQAIEAIAKALGVSLDVPQAEGTKSYAQLALEEQIDLVKQLQSAYNDLVEYVDDNTMRETLSKFFPRAKKEWIESLDFKSTLIELANKLERYDKDAANKLRTSIGHIGIKEEVDRLKGVEKAYKDSAKAAGEYFDELRKWASEDFTIEGEGITFDISKITSDLREKTNEIRLRAQKARELFGQIDVDSEEEVAKVKEIFVKEFGVDAWDEFWNAYYTNGLDVIQDLADKQIEYEKKVAQERVDDLAAKYVKESYFTEGIELSDLADKTLLQLRRIKKQLQNLMKAEPLEIPVKIEDSLRSQGVDLKNLKGVYLDEIFEALADAGQPIDESTQSIIKLRQKLQEAGLDTEKFGEVIKKVFKGDMTELSDEVGKTLSDMIKGYLGDMQDMFESIGEFAEQIGNDKLQGAMNGIVQAMDALGGMADRLANGDWIGAIISGLTSLTKIVLDALSAQEELNNAIAETRREMMLLASENAIAEGVESILGTDEYKRFTNAYEEAVAAHKKATEDIQKQNKKMYGNEKDDWGQWGIAGAAGAGAALGAAVGSIFPVIGTAIGAGLGALVGMITGLVGNAATEANNYAKTLQQMADEIGAELIEEDTGTFNVETLKKIKETYKDLNSDYQEMLDELIVNAEVFENAITNMATYMTDIFGQCADSMADAFIESFKASGQAALEYGDIMNDIASNIAKSMIKSAIIQNVWNDDKSKEAAMMLASGNAAGAMSIVDEAMRAAQDLAPHIQELLKSLEPYLAMEEETGQTLGDGIKGITEDTASLLASYINAMRSDLSLMRGIQAKYLPAIGESMPSIMDHLAKIQANTYNTAISNANLLTATQAILSELSSVLAYEGGERAVRIIS